MAKKTIQDIDVKGRRGLGRVDFNVPLTPEGTVADDKRITAAMPTVKYLLEQGAKVILCSHLGRPKGAKPEPEFSLRPVAARLGELLPGVHVEFAEDTIGESAKAAIAKMQPGEIVLLENVRFYKEETANDPAFSKELASLADIFVSDAFGTVHRAHSSTAGVAAYLPAVAGFLIGKELSIMGERLRTRYAPSSPYSAAQK
jgi:phosphoglycerate kinase